MCNQEMYLEDRIEIRRMKRHFKQRQKMTEKILVSQITSKAPVAGTYLKTTNQQENNNPTEKQAKDYSLQNKMASEH